MEIVSKDLQLVWDEFHTHLRDYPTEPGELRTLWGKFVRLLGYLSEERARLKGIISKHSLQKKPEEFLAQVRTLSLKGTSHDERRLYMSFSSPSEERVAQTALEEIESMIDSLYRIERVLKGYYRVMALDMKLSFEGHE